MPRLTLCLIARDEERMLPDCLRSVRGVVDEIVVVDTGSRDRTRAIALAAGARVVEHPWQDSFAAARNAALPAAKGDWLLILDADERLGPGATKALQRALKGTRADCFLLPLHNASRHDATHEEVLSGAARRGEPVWLPRLLRRTPDLAWEGVVHESVGSWLTRGSRTVARADACIVHYGAIPEYRTTLNKDERNLNLLDRQCELTPDDPAARAYLARELIRCGELPRADREIDRAWENLRRAVVAGQHPARVSLVSIRAHRLLERDAPDAVLDMIREARTWGALPHPNLHLLSGMAWTRKASLTGEGWDHAEASFRAALAAPKEGWNEEVLPGALGWHSAVRLAITLLAQGRPTEALPWIERAKVENPQNLDILLAHVEALVSLDPTAALQQVEPHLTLDSADAWLLAAQACEALGASADRQTFLGQALRLPLLTGHRRARLLAARTLNACGPLFAAHRPRRPAPAGLASLVAAGADAALAGDIEGALGAWTAALRQAPTCTPAWAALVRALDALGYDDAAMAGAAGARALAPRDPELLLLSADLSLVGERHGEACRFARALLDIEPGNADASAILEATGVHDDDRPRAPHPAVRAGAPPLLSVLVTPAGGPGAERNLRDALALQDLPAGAFEVLVLPDGGTLENNANARNAALAEARGQWILFYDADVLPAPDALRRHLDAHLELEGASAGDRAVMGAHTPLPEHRDDPLVALLPPPPRWFVPADPSARVWAEFRTSNLSVSADALRRVGGFNRVFACREVADAELGLRLARAGVHLQPAPDIVAEQDRLPTLARFLSAATTLGHEAARLHRHLGWPALPTFDGRTPAEEKAGLRERVEAATGPNERLELSVIPAIARGLPGRREDRERLTGALSALARHRFERGVLDATAATVQTG